jgi:hypothetical protein
MNDRESRESQDPQDVVNQEENSAPLTTRDMAAGAATGRAREEQQPEQAVSEAQTAAETNAPLFDTGETDAFRSRWISIQTQFVDEPRRSVEQADELVAQTMKRLAEIFAAERENLEREWDRGDNVSTEDLRIALQRYRSFFDRLLTV